MTRSDCVQGWIRLAVSGSEQTEAYIFASLEMKGATTQEIDEAIGALLDARAIRSTVITDRGRMTYENDFRAVRHVAALAQV